jgi:hypothetical protein
MSSVTVKQKQEPTGLGAVLKARVDLWLVVALMAMSFGAGVIVKTLSEPPAAPAVSTTQTGVGTLAPPLTDQQIQGGLPADHPDFTDGDGGTGTGSQGGGQGGGN